MTTSHHDSAPLAAGSFVVHHDGQTSSGLSAAQVAELIETHPGADLKIYRIHRVQPDGQMELCGVSAERFQLEDGFFFLRDSLEIARADFLTLCRLAERTPPPCRASVQLAELTGAWRPFVVAMLYPAEYGPDMSDWLLRIGYEGGSTVEGGVSAVTSYLSAERKVVFRQQLWGVMDGTLRQGSDKSAIEAS
mgnify:CR=1 FL=1